MLPEAMLAQLRERLTEQMGLTFSGEGWRDFEARISAASQDAGAPDSRQYVDRLLAAPMAQSTIETLARHLTVGETYFFREKASFEALEADILPALLRRREASGRRLRIWSAGCCTGEEAYSIAILLDRLLPGQADWDITIAATDINPLFLEKARQGIYGDWSFRGTPDWVRDRYFRSKRNGTFEVLPKIRQRVRFSYFNLAGAGALPHFGPGGRLDLIFCRNVLMYFSQAQAARVITRFRAALHDEGLLLVSPAETSTRLFRDFTALYYPNAIFYRPRDASAMRPGGAPAAPPASSPTLQPPPARRSTRADRPARTPLASRPEKGNAEEFVREARRNADAGRLDEAARWCARATAADKLNPAHHFLRATIEQERGRVDDAVQALQSTLYLDQDFILAHFAMANLMLAAHRYGDAARHLDIVRGLLKNFAPEDILPESEGMTAGRLDEISASLSASLTEMQRPGEGRK